LRTDVAGGLDKLLTLMAGVLDDLHADRPFSIP
jgi:hypothetical protein